MISQPEYLANSAQLQQIAQSHADQLSQRLESVNDLNTAVNATRNQADLYHGEFEDLLSTALAQTGNTTVDHYDRILDLNLSDTAKHEIVSEAIMRQPTEPYYGASLNQRLQASRFTNAQRIVKSSRVGATLDAKKLNLTRIFNEAYPFGSQAAFDQRILLGQCVKLEHDVAKLVGKQADIIVVKWTLSHRHKVKDICDEYAERIDKRVVEYLRLNDVRVNPRGCYFLEEVPDPPHPNCQCTLEMLHEGRFVPNIVDRAIEKIKELLGKLRRRRKN